MQDRHQWGLCTKQGVSEQTFESIHGVTGVIFWNPPIIMSDGDISSGWRGQLVVRATHPS